MNADAARRDPAHAPPASGGPPPSRPAKKRVRNFTADDRAAHREFEKGRRKAFRERLAVCVTPLPYPPGPKKQTPPLSPPNPTTPRSCAKFVPHVADTSGFCLKKQELASHIPALANVEPQKLSKHVVVEESIARHEQLEAGRVEALAVIQALAREREELLAEVNTWRAGAGLPPRERTASASIQCLAAVEANPRQHHARVAGAGSSTPEPSIGYHPLHVPGEQLDGAHYAPDMASTAGIIDGAQLPDNDVEPMWSLMDAQGIPAIPNTGAFADASRQNQPALMAELGIF